MLPPGRDNDQFTPLLLASGLGNVEMATLLLHKGRAHINARGPFQRTSLHRAVIGGHFLMVKLLVNARYVLVWIWRSSRGGIAHLHKFQSQAPVWCPLDFPSLIFLHAITLKMITKIIMIVIVVVFFCLKYYIERTPHSRITSVKRQSISAGSGQQDAETNDQVSFPSAGRHNTRPSLICSRASPMCTTPRVACSERENSQGSSGGAPLRGA